MQRAGIHLSLFHLFVTFGRNEYISLKISMIILLEKSICGLMLGISGCSHPIIDPTALGSLAPPGAPGTEVDPGNGSRELRSFG